MSSQPSQGRRRRRRGHRHHFRQSQGQPGGGPQDHGPGPDGPEPGDTAGGDEAVAVQAPPADGPPGAEAPPAPASNGHAAPPPHAHSPRPHHDRPPHQDRHQHQQHQRHGHDRPHGQHGQHGQGHASHNGQGPRHELQTLVGTLEVTEKGTAFLRSSKRNYASQPNDPQIHPKLMSRFRLRPGVTLECVVDARRGGPPQVMDINTIMGRPPAEWMELPLFDDLSVIDPRQQLRFETAGGPTSMRVVDLMTPIGRGQRGLVVAPPRTGKTILLQQMAAGIAANYPEIYMMVLLVDERPEEVTEMRRTVRGEVVASSNDQDIYSHVRLTRLMSEKAKRHVENGEHILVLMDSLTRLGRAFNNYVGSSGRTMTGGLDIKAMEDPKKIFGAARNIEGGGSLTIIASALIDTGSRMDDFIFQEFKGTGNMEIVLDREMANRRVYPAIDLQQSGTRKEELLLGRENAERLARQVRRRLLDVRSNVERMELMLKMLGHHKTNADFLANLPK